MKIAILHRYPPEQVVGTNASFMETLSLFSKNGHSIYYITYKDNSNLPQLKNLNYVFLPFYFNRGNNIDKLVKTLLWILLSPFYVLYCDLQTSLDLVYCDDSVPYYGFITKVINPTKKVIIRLGDLQIGYMLADKHPLLFRIGLMLEIFMWKRLDGIIAISDEFKKFVVGKGIRHTHVGIVEESINLTEQIAVPKRKKNGTFLFHGALLGCKGLETLLLAFKDVQIKHPKTKLIIAGGGDQERRLKLFVRRSLMPNVLFSGWYNHKDLADLMNKADIGIVMRSPNIANNFVVTTCLLENWKYKKPIIAPDLNSFNRVITKSNGILFRSGSAKDLYEKMDYLYTHKELWDDLGRSGYDTAKRKYSHTIIAQKMYHLLSSFA